MSDLTIYKGIPWERTLTVTRADTGAVRNLTGATVVAKIKKRSNDADPAVLLPTVTILDQTTDEGEATLSLAAGAAVALDEGNYVIAVYVTPQGETVPQVVIVPTKIAIRSAP
jgi:hypothetical protein